MARHLQGSAGITDRHLRPERAECVLGRRRRHRDRDRGGTGTPHQIFGGVLALDALQVYNLRFDKAFLACTGVSAEDGITNFGFEEIPMKRKAIETAHEAILLADSSKVGVRATGFIAPASRIQRLITDGAASQAQVEALRRLGITVELV